MWIQIRLSIKVTKISIGLDEYFSMAEDIGIISTLFVILYFSNK
jgi:hypothetical protein